MRVSKSESYHLRENKEVRSPAILLTYGAAGFYAIILQTIVFRELLVVALGNEIVLGISLFNWLIGIFVGAFIGGYRTDRISHVLKTFIISFLLLIGVSPLSLTFIRLLHSVSSTPQGSHIPFFTVFSLSAILVVPLGFFIGFTFPLASRIHVRENPDAPKKITFISRVYIFESLGSLLGGVMVSFFLAGYFNSYFILSLSSLPLLGLLAFDSTKIRGKKMFISVSIILAFELFMLTPAGSNRIDHFMTEKRWKGFSHSQLIWNRDSRYQNLAIGKSHGQFNLYANGQFSTSFPEASDNLVLAAHLVSQHPGPKKILIIGEAISGLARQLLDFGIEKLRSVEIDNALINGVSKFLPVHLNSIFSDPRFSVRIGDGRKYVKEPGRENSDWDIVFIHVAEPSTLLLNRFYTREFFQDISSILATDGILCLRITSSENYFSSLISQYTASIYHTLRKVFPHIVVAPGNQNFFFASRTAGILSYSPEILSQRYIKTGARPAKLAKIFPSLYPPEKTLFVSNALKSHKTAILNTDDRPMSNFYFNKILGWTSGSKTEGFFHFFERIKLLHIIFFLVGIFLCRLIWLMIKAIPEYYHQKKKDCQLNFWLPLKSRWCSGFHIFFAVICVGFSGISLELLVIYSFQNIFGYIYQLIGFIIALFMTGLPLGAQVSNLLLKKKKMLPQKQLGLLIMTQITFVVLTLIFPVLLKVISILDSMGKVLIFLYITAIGGLVGIIFPLALELVARRQPQAISRAAGFVDASDHLGAAIGAFLTGALLLPVLGITGVSKLIAAISALSVLFLILQLAGEKAVQTTKQPEIKNEERQSKN